MVTPQPSAVPTSPNTAETGVRHEAKAKAAAVAIKATSRPERAVSALAASLESGNANATNNPAAATQKPIACKRALTSPPPCAAPSILQSTSMIAISTVAITAAQTSAAQICTVWP